MDTEPSAMKMLALIPSRSRPQAAKELWKAFEATESSCRLLFAVDEDDETLEQYIDLLGEEMVAITPSAGVRGVVYPLNYWTRIFKNDYEYFAFMGDDHRPRTKGWDKALAKVIDMGADIAYGDDLLQGRNLATAGVIAARIVRAFDGMAPDCLQHLYVDNFWMQVGSDLKTLYYCTDVIIEHLHFINGKAPKDELYAAINDPVRYREDGERLRHYIASDEYKQIIESLKN
jgi:hypothetical protein